MFHKEKLTTTPYQKVLNLLSFLLFLGLFLYPVLIWSKIPDEITTHYNFAGETDAFGSKSSLRTAAFCRSFSRYLERSC